MIMRLDQFLSKALHISRKDAQLLLKKNKVLVNKKKINKSATKLNPISDIVELETREVKLPETKYFMLNKPLGYVCSSEDSSNKTVYDLFSQSDKYDLKIVGRLDVDTTGLVLMTENGKWLHNVISPNKKCAKKYLVGLEYSFDMKYVREFEQGFFLKNEIKKTKPAHIEILSKKKLYITIHEGKYHQIKRMFASIGNKVNSLQRIQIGNIKLDENLNLGEYRRLTDLEIASFL